MTVPSDDRPDDGVPVSGTLDAWLGEHGHGDRAGATDLTLDQTNGLGFPILGTGAGFERPRMDFSQVTTLLDGSLQGSSLTGTTIGYSFLGTGSSGLWSLFSDVTGPFSWSATERSQIRLALQQISDVTNLNFVDIGANITGATLTFEHFRHDSGLVGIGGFPNMGALGAPGYEGAIGFNVNFLGEEMQLARGGLGFGVALHEIGHTLGLKHPHDDGAMGQPTFSQLGLSAFDRQAYTVMSYNDPGFATTGHAGQLGLLDVYSLQQLYGARAHNTGDTVYRPANYQQVVWDTGGTDTIDMSGGVLASGAIVAAAGLAVNEGVYIDLRQGGISAGSQTNATAGLFGIAFGAVIENAVGTANADTIVGNDVANQLVGGGGNDAIDGGAGDDTLDGGAGNDLLNGGTGGDWMEGGAGDDTYTVDDIGDIAIEAAGNGYDRVFSTIDYGIRNDVEELRFEAGTGDLSGWGNRGDNALIGNDGRNVLRGGAGADRLFGSGADDILVGHDGDDQLFGGADDDILSGRDGNDTLNGGPGADRMDGGTGDDEYVVDNVGDIAMEFANEGYDRVIASIDYGIRNDVEELELAPGTKNLNGWGNRGANVLIGNDGANVLKGGDSDDDLRGAGGDDVLIGHDGNDVLTGGAGTDVLSGRDGDDVLDGGTGGDWMAGGAGDDEYRVDSKDDVVVESFGEGYDRVIAALNYALSVGIEELVFAPGNGDWTGWGNREANTLIGNDGANMLKGGGGDDVLQGGGGGDRLIGHDGNDLLIGEGGDDILVGRDGDDILDGGSGDDLLFGDEGSDLFVFGFGSDRDTITDFDPVDDGIDVRAFGFADFDAVMATAHEIAGDTGLDTVFDFTAADGVTVLGVQRDAFTVDHFLI